MLAGAAGLLAVGSATVGLLWLGWPDRLLGGLAWVSGQREEWDRGRLSESDEEALLAAAARLRPLVVGAVLVSSFAAGALIAAARVAGA